MKNRYYIAALSAFVIWGFFSLALKPIAAYASLDILFYRVFLAAGMMMLLLPLMGKKFREENLARYRALTTREKVYTIGSTFLGGALLTGNWYFFIYAMNNISIKSASYAYLVCPILTTVLAYFILKEKLSALQWFSVALSAASCAVLSFHNMRDLMYSLVVAFSYAFYLISQRNNDKVDKLIILAFQMVFSALILLPFYPAYAAPLPQDSHFYLFIAIISLGFTIVPLFLNLYALKGMNSSTMGILLYINPVMNFAVAWVFFKEPTTQTQWLSYSLIFVSILLFNYQTLRPKRVAAGDQ